MNSHHSVICQNLLIEFLQTMQVNLTCCLFSQNRIKFSHQIIITSRICLSTMYFLHYNKNNMYKQTSRKSSEIQNSTHILSKIHKPVCEELVFVTFFFVFGRNCLINGYSFGCCGYSVGSSTGRTAGSSCILPNSCYHSFAALNTNLLYLLLL